MPNKTFLKKSITRLSVTTIFFATLINTNIQASEAVFISPFNATNQVYSNDSISFFGYGSPDTYTGASFLNNSAWGENGTWFTFRNHDVTNVIVSVSGDAEFSPGLSVWATGENEFDGGTYGFGEEISSAFFDTPASFNATGDMGDPGTAWMANGQGGNVIETLGYAVANPAIDFTSGTGWGETIQFGAHDVSLTNSFENGVTGGVDANSASLEFNNLASGWYTVYVGGTDASLFGGNYDLVVSAVPESETWAMLLVGLGFIGWRLRNQLPQAPNIAPVI